MAARPSSRKIRSLAEDLRARSDDALITLLQQRPDLARPTIPDLRTLAARATSTPSAARALDNLAPANSTSCKP
ncbi:hypothetical protein [Dermatophilus congolensis]|nr:hypothetical protein [Dermatophilus congolensis]